MTNRSAQLAAALAVAGFGCLLIAAALFIPPMGVIDPSVLAALGELLTFAGAVIGVDYHYRDKGPGDRSGPRPS